MTRRSVAGAILAAAGPACQRNQKKRIAVIPKATSHIFWLAVKAGAVAAGRELNVDIEWNGPAAETDFARQIQIVDSMVARRMDGIVLAATDRQALTQVVDRAMSAGIPTTIFDSGLDSENYTSFVATGNLEAGRMAGRELGRLLNGKGKVAMIQHVPGSVSTQDRETGFEEAIAKEFPGIQLVQKLYGMSDRAKSMAAGAGLTLGRTLRIEESGGQVVPKFNEPYMMARGGLADAGTPTPIAPSDIEIRAQVSLTIEVK